MERRMREPEECRHATLKRIADGVIATDVYGRVRFLNPVAERFTGWDQRDAVGARLDEVFDVVNEGTGQSMSNPIEEALERGIQVGVSDPAVLVGRNGLGTPVEGSAALMRDRRGRVVGAVLVFQDVGTRRRMERERERLTAWAISAPEAERGLLARESDDVAV